MLGELVSTKRYVINLSRCLHYLVYPFSTGFLLDLPWLNQLIISICLAIVVVLVGNYADALVKLWQAIAVSGFALMVITGISGSTLNSTTAALSVPITLLLLAMCARGDSKTKSHDGAHFIAEFLTVLTFIYLAINAPRGRSENLNFISHEDNAKQLMAPMRASQTGQISFNALNLEDRESVGYFAKFVANFTQNLGLGASDSSALRSINSISNAWVLTFVSFLVIGVHLNKWFMFKFDLKNKSLFLIASFIILFRSFYVSHLHGFLPLFLLGLAGVILMYTFREFDRESYFAIFLNATIGVALACAMFGSWQPWAPIGFTAIILVIYKAFGRRNLRFVLSPLVFIPITLGVAYVLIRRLPSLIQNADLESGGPAYVDTEIFIIYGVIITSVVLTWFHLRSHSESNVDVEAFKSNSNIDSFFILGTITAVSLTIIFKFTQNQAYFISLLVFLGYLFAHRVPRDFSKRISYSLSEVSDLPYIFLIISFSYILAIYLASRFIGPNYFASYAAHKSGTAFLAQFTWVPLLVIGVLGQKKFESTLSRLLSYVTIVLLLFSVNKSLHFLPGSGESRRVGDDFNWIALRYQPVTQKWWHEPVVNSLSSAEDQIIICSNSEIDSKDYQTYICNRFLHSLFNETIQSEFRAQTVSVFGPQPIDLSRIRLYLRDNDLGKPTSIFSREPMSDEMLALFSTQDSKMVKFESGF